MVDLVQSEAGATFFTDATIPDDGFFYLLKPDCPGGSWQSTANAEPGRDAALP